MIDWDSIVINPLVGVFGQSGFLTQAGQTYPLSGIFDEVYTNIDVVDGMPVTTKMPCFSISLTEIVVIPKQKSKLFIPASFGAPLNNTNYIIREVQNDGHGWCRLLLNVSK